MEKSLVQLFLKLPKPETHVRGTRSVTTLKVLTTTHKAFCRGMSSMPTFVQMSMSDDGFKWVANQKYGR